MNRLSLVAAVAALVSVTMVGGAQQTPHPRPTGDSLARSGRVDGGRRTVAIASAMRAARAPLLDGREDDETWARARVVEGFREFDPVEDGEPPKGFQTVAKVAYDDRNLYVLVRAYDPHPDSILPLLSRRDVRTPTDWIKVVIDSYYDRRTGFQFMVNPAGVKRDANIINDGDEDMSWDAVWDAAARIDSAGWVAEFRIPFNQLRYPSAPAHTFGFGIWRDVGRHNRRLSWPLFRRTQAGFASQLGDLAGIVGIPAARRLEVAPYVVQKNVTEARPSGDGFRHPLQTSAGADIKYGLTSNLTLDATINPDFGQVEADPSILNLTAFEQAFQERRPFFLEGTGIFRFDLSCNDGNCSGLFYSRRIGRSPQLRGRDEFFDPRNPTSTTILGAAKLTGRTGGGLSIGVLDAVTQQELGKNDLTIEPATNYLVGRLQQDFRRGRSGVGAMVTMVNRDLKPENVPLLRREGYAGGLDFRHRFASDRYELSGYLTGSRVMGDTAALRRTQQSGVHNFQRPDSRLEFDPTRTTLDGAAAQIWFNKMGGGITRFSTGYYRFSPGFEINDAGFQSRADQQGQSGWFALVFNNPRAFYRRLQVNFNQWNQWNVRDGLPIGRGGNINANTFLKSQWFLFSGISTQNVGAVYDDRDARGGPAFRLNRFVGGWVGFEGDSRKRVTPEVFNFFGRGDEGRSRVWEFGPNVVVRASSRFTMSVGPSIVSNIDDSQFYDVVTTEQLVRNAQNEVVDTIFTDHYVFARLNQRLLSVQSRLDYTLTPTLSLQLYAQPFLSSGRFRNLRELGDPRARDYDRRFVPFPESSLPDGAVDNSRVNRREFRSNSVLRWEYRPGSTLFVVWSQGRDDSGPFPGSFDTGRDYRRLFRTHPDNTFLVKASYWFSL